MSPKRARRNPFARLQARPLPADWPEDEPMTLPEAVAVFWPDGPLTITSLRTAIRNGDLAFRKIAGKVFTTPRALKEMTAVRRADPPNAVAAGTEVHGAQDANAASAAALETVRRLRREALAHTASRHSQ